MTTDQKIEQLVRSVLAAVDTRLGEVRDEMQALAADVERRHHAVLLHLQELEGRIEHGAVGAAPSGSDPLAARMEQATQVLLERIEAMHQRNTIATNERFASLTATVDQLRGSTLANAAPPAPPAPLLHGLDEMSAPLRVPTSAMTTGQVPVLAPLPEPERAPTADAAPTAAAAAEPAAPAGSEPIDLSKLADLLSERLGHLSLPPRQS
jgi:hypothetical protein